MNIEEVRVAKNEVSQLAKANGIRCSVGFAGTQSSGWSIEVRVDTPLPDEFQFPLAVREIPVNVIHIGPVRALDSATPSGSVTLEDLLEQRTKIVDELKVALDGVLDVGSEGLQEVITIVEDRFRILEMKLKHGG